MGAILAAAAFAAVLPPLQAAERQVGLEAQGVDPMAALRNAEQLDVRDALGRPVSAAVIEKQLKAAAAGATVQASYSSRLPQVRAVALMLEFLKWARASFRQPWPSLPVFAVFALPARGKSQASVPIVIFALACSLALTVGQALLVLPVLPGCSCQKAILRC